MKKLFCRLLILFLLVFATMIIIILIPLPPNSYHLAIIDKHKRLENTEAPRIVLAGGSNLAFGIDSELIQDALDIPVINTGLQAGFGLGRMLDDLAPFFGPGDILVIVPEYQHFDSDWNGDEAAYNLICDARQYRLLVNPPLYGFPSGISSYLRSKVSAMIPGPPAPLAYTRDGFNGYGDYVKHLGVENQKFVSLEPLKTLERQYLEQFFRLVDTFAMRGIRVLISYPSYEESPFLASETFIHELDEAFKDRAVTVISNPQDYAFSRSYFYDTSYHLNAEGRELRTTRLIRDLERYYQGGSTDRTP
ncbi:MAG: hypothetical protein LBO04_00465 [Spirochaetaceae bacterium]|jgi:hypothetical protein|nr:hypothetical protein [Spirochaetaceae bacterium]